MIESKHRRILTSNNLAIVRRAALACLLFAPIHVADALIGYGRDGFLTPERASADIDISYFAVFDTVIFAPLIEEFFFRKPVKALTDFFEDGYRFWRYKGAFFWVFATISSLLFSSFHLQNFFGGVSVATFIFGMLACVLSRKDGIAVSIAFHMLWNFGAVVLVLVLNALHPS